ncbi:MAG: NUDIX domain-containing protein [Candidatus Aenigmarchaeota archaeon]|nr:NUDIX domain-containing protein [Candidatus Aenigmarchaeota archaeon]
MSDELLDIVDGKNVVIGQEKRDVAHSKGLFHRAVNIFIFNPEGKIFLQKRSANKDVCPSTWDLSASETLKSGEDHHQAAMRGVQEELGIKPRLIKIRGIHLQKNEYFNGRIRDYEFVELYKAVHEGKINLDKDEIAEGRFFDAEEIKRTLKDNKNKFTPWFLDEWKFMEENNLV